MHDPLVVLFQVRRPWPQCTTSVVRPGRRWWIGFHAHWAVAGRWYYFPALVTVWHREPGGRDEGEVCGRSFRRVLHVHHWHVQLHPYQRLRRRLLTRCAWCGGRDRRGRGGAVNISHQWGGTRSPWWRGERGLFHSDCSAVENAHRLCYCDDPLLDHDGHGKCALCGGHRAWNQVPDEADRLLRALPAGSRIPASLRPELEAAWERRREARESAP